MMETMETMDTSCTDGRHFEVETTLTVRTYDVDFSGVVSQLTYHRWLEDLWVAMLARHRPLQRQVDGGSVPVVSRTALHARHAVGLGDSVRARMWVSQAGHCRWTLAAEFAVGSRVSATATQTGCFVDLETRRPVPLPMEVRRATARSVPPEPMAAPGAGPGPRPPAPGRLRFLLARDDGSA
jgi:acyl-CoA thioester hydrolase